MDEISQKISRRDIKSKYLKCLAILQRYPPMEIIKESTIEDLDDDVKSPRNFKKRSKIKINNNKSPNKEFINKIKDRLTKAIIRNKIDEFREILDNHYDFIDINQPLTNFHKFAAIHEAAFYGYQQILLDLINKYNADVNAISLNKWSALHLSAYKGYVDIVNILIQFKDTNCDLCLPKIGTALHLACKRNNFKMVSLLLHKCDPKIKNEMGKLPIDITSDKNIKKLINKVMFSSCDNKIIEKNDEWDLKVKHDNNVNKNNKINHFQFLDLLSNGLLISIKS